MFLVRDIFTARPGQASKLAQQMKEVARDLIRAKTRVLTDFVGDYNTVVMETEVGDLAEFERSMKEYAEKPEFRKRMTGYTDLWLSGRREILRVVE